MDHTLLGIGLVLGRCSLLAFAAVSARRATGSPPSRHGRWPTGSSARSRYWFLLGGTIYTAYTFAAVPGLVYGAGALGFFALPTRSSSTRWRSCCCPGCGRSPPSTGTSRSPTTCAAGTARRAGPGGRPDRDPRHDAVRRAAAAGHPGGARGRRALPATGSPATLILALVFAVLAGGDVPQRAARPDGDLAREGRARVRPSRSASAWPRWIGSAGPERVFDGRAQPAGDGAPAASADARPVAARRLRHPRAGLGDGAADVPARAHRRVRRRPAATRCAAASSPCPPGPRCWRLFALLGIAARAAGVEAPLGNAEAAVPMLVADLMPALLTGLVFGALAVGRAGAGRGDVGRARHALHPQRLRRVLPPDATPSTQTRVARIVSLVVKVGALALRLRPARPGRHQPAAARRACGSCRRSPPWRWGCSPAGCTAARCSPAGRSAWWPAPGWWPTAGSPHSSRSGVGGYSTQVYAAVVALAVNLAVAVALTPLFDRLGMPRGSTRLR